MSVFKSKGFHEELLPGYWQTQHVCCLSLPDPHTLSSPRCTPHQQEGERKQRAYFLYMWPAFYTMEQEVPGNCNRGFGV